MDGFFVPAGFESVTLTSWSALIAHSITDCPTPQGSFMLFFISNFNYAIFYDFIFSASFLTCL
jgi:hypothetical protein